MMDRTIPPGIDVPTELPPQHDPHLYHCRGCGMEVHEIEEYSQISEWLGCPDCTQRFAVGSSGCFVRTKDKTSWLVPGPWVPGQ